MSGVADLLRRSSLRRQLAVVMAFGVFCLALLSSLAISWQGARLVRANLIEQGQQAAENLARQSKLALLYDAPENVAEAVKLTLAFPGVVGLDIRHGDGRLLVGQRQPAAVLPALAETPVRLGQQAMLEAEADDSWTFVAPIFSGGTESPFDTVEPAKVLLGYARIIQSKETLLRMRDDVFLLNFSISFLLAAVFLLVVHALTTRLTRPLVRLSETMSKADAVATGVRADLAGPREIANMAQAFNKMMGVLADREQELRDARDSALKFARLKANFAATVSHEIRTPLNGVIGTLDILKATELPAKQQQLVDIAWDSSQYLLDLINNILDFSRLEAGKLEVDNITFALAPTLENVIELLSPQAAQKGLDFGYLIAPDVPPQLLGDPRRLRQILVNLVGNAIKFTDSGSIEVRVGRAAAQPDQAPSIRFEVIDTGIGIPEVAQASIFDSFTQADTSTTRRFGGSGLGLAICKQLVSLLGGHIGVGSRLEQGSCFWFEVPMSAAPMPAPPLMEPVTPLSSQLGSESMPPPFGGCRLLVVEDNRTNQEVARSMLVMLGCDVHLANEGQAGLAAFQRQPWDLVLMDCSMPGMDGYEATAAIRAIEAARGTHTPVVAMTANVQPSDITKCLDAGMDAHLAKPLTLEQVTQMLQRWLPHFSNRPPALPVTAVQAPAATQPLDHGVFGKLRDILGKSIENAIYPFLEDMPNYLDQMEQAAHSGHWQQLRRAAHAIKGAAGNLGAGPLAAVAKEIEERTTDDGSDIATTDLLAKARAEYFLVHEALLTELDSAPLARQARQGPNTLVLIVDDDRSTRTALRFAMQRNGYSVEEATDGTAALAAVARTRPDVVLMDAMMPHMDGFTACAKLQKSPASRDVPVLMITALDDAQSIQRAFAAGASDYIAKPINLDVVNQRVKRVVEANRTERDMRHLTLNDGLTGLPNRVMFADKLHQAIDKAKAAASSLAVLFLDLDRFKLINESLSHEIGDRLLKEVAGRIRRCVRASDCVARPGGDEFTVLLDDLGSPGAAAGAAEKIRRALAKPYADSGHDMFISVSIGISVYPSDGPDVSTLLRHAESAMYRAKRLGTLGYEFYEPGMEASMSEYLRLDSALRRALERNELLVHYQPKANTASGRITGAEALVRWQHPSRGMIPPFEFIPLAEETGLINQIGEMVLRSACAQAKSWLQAGLSDISVAVNISGIQLQDRAFPTLLASILEQTGLPASHLTIEVTESVLMSHTRGATLSDLKNLGLRIEIDDFGTGYSSLAYLKRFPVDALKIDCAFTRDMTSSADDAAIVAAIIALAHSLRLEVIAEGVETASQRDMLLGLGCDLIQGYYLSEPVPPAAITEQLLRQQFGHAHFPEQRIP
jgi:diguanylate cyclase (GGDEF)-like protein